MMEKTTINEQTATIRLTNTVQKRRCPARYMERIKTSPTKNLGFG